MKEDSKDNDFWKLNFFVQEYYSRQWLTVQESYCNKNLQSYYVYKDIFHCKVISVCLLSKFFKDWPGKWLLVSVLLLP